MGTEDVPERARLTFDRVAYRRRVQAGPCFVCATAAKHPEYRHHVFYDDGITMGFLSRYPTLLGYAIIAPRSHIERWEQDQSLKEHLALQEVLYLTGRAMAEVLPIERVYAMSLGSDDGNAHVHWHLAPLPPGVPFERQQFHALMVENGVLDLDDEALGELARSLSAALQRSLTDDRSPHGA